VSKVATRDRILQAALQVFAEKGYHRALVDDIVQASRTSKGAVYHHFPNKEALFLALVDEFIHADGVVHPAEIEFRNDLASLLGQPTRAETAVPTAGAPSG